MTDQEIFDALSVPEDRREQLAAWLHAWSKATLPGPHGYAVAAAVFWNVLQRGLIDPPTNVFDPLTWVATEYEAPSIWNIQ